MTEHAGLEAVTIIAAVIASFGMGWSAHRRRVYWASIAVRGMLEQWTEDKCGYLLGRQDCEEMDGIVAEVLKKQHMPPLFFRKTRRRKPVRGEAGGMQLWL